MVTAAGLVHPLGGDPVDAAADVQVEQRALDLALTHYRPGVRHSLGRKGFALSTLLRVKAQFDSQDEPAQRRWHQA
jgi:hypothetical protein